MSELVGVINLSLLQSVSVESIAVRSHDFSKILTFVIGENNHPAIFLTNGLLDVLHRDILFCGQTVGKYLIVSCQHSELFFFVMLVSRSTQVHRAAY